MTLQFGPEIASYVEEQDCMGFVGLVHSVPLVSSGNPIKNYHLCVAQFAGSEQLTLDVVAACF